MALAACAAAGGLRWWLGHTVGEVSPFLTFYPAVILAALLGGTVTGLFATVLSLLAVNLFFLEPHGGLALASEGDLVNMLIFGVVNAGISIVAGRLRAARHAGTYAKRILEQTGDAFFHVDSRERFTYVNSQAERLLSRRREELIGRDVWQCFSPAVDGGFQRIYRGAAAEKAPHHFEAHCRPTGAWFDVNAHPADGGLAVFFRDITARKQAEDALRESEEKFRGLVENMGTAAGIVQGTRFVYVNNRMAELLGYTVEELLTKHFPELVHPQDRPLMIERARQRQMGEPAPSHYEFLALTKSGEERWFDFWPALISYHGQPAIIGTGIDITERKRAEEALRQSERFIKSVAEASPNCFYVFDFDRIGVTYMNRSIMADLGYPPDLQASALELEAFRTFMPPEEMPHLERLLQQWRTLADGSVRDDEYRLRHADGSWRYFAGREVVFARRDDGTVRQILGSLTDITARKWAEKELAAAKAAAEQASKAKDHFLAVLSHELRTPLTPVLAGLSLLQTRGDFDEETREHLEIMRRNAEMETRLIDDLLDVTRIARGKVELNRRPVSLCEVVRRAVEVCEPDLEARGIAFGVDLHDTPYTVFADAARLQQVFWNLLRNSIKFTPHGGRIAIRGYRLNSAAVVEVTDTGIGIEPDVLPRLFDAFEQAERSITRQFGGLGLGLTISKALVEMHGGTITAFSRGKDQGATFTVQLPVHAHSAQPPEARPAQAPETAAAAQAAGLRILLVEDHGDTARMIARLLKDSGHTVETAGDVATALQQAQARTFDLLISDLGLPDGSGIDLLNQLRTGGFREPALAITGYGHEEDFARTRAAGFAAHVVKPIDCDQITRAIAQAAGRPAAVPGGHAEPRT